MTVEITVNGSADAVSRTVVVDAGFVMVEAGFVTVDVAMVVAVMVTLLVEVLVLVLVVVFVVLAMVLVLVLVTVTVGAARATSVTSVVETARPLVTGTRAQITRRRVRQMLNFDMFRRNQWRSFSTMECVYYSLRRQDKSLCTLMKRIGSYKYI